MTSTSWTSGAVQELQNCLDMTRLPAIQVADGINTVGFGQIPSEDSQSAQNDAQRQHPPRDGSTGRPRNQAPPQGLRQRHRGHVGQQNGLDEVDNDVWLLPVFQYDTYGTKAVHIPVGTGMSDEALFKALKEYYFKVSNRFRRFLSLKAVTKISFVKVCTLTPKIVLTLICRNSSSYTGERTSAIATPGLPSAIVLLWANGFTSDAQRMPSGCPA